jgi:hypothetical protein
LVHVITEPAVSNPGDDHTSRMLPWIEPWPGMPESGGASSMISRIARFSLTDGSPHSAISILPGGISRRVG